MNQIQSVTSLPRLFIKQTFELAEVLGFETRNKYKISDETGQQVGFAAEQQKGILGFLFRQFLGHWRTFAIHFYDMNRQEFMVADHPFRWYFQRFEVRDMQGRMLGAVERRFAIFTKRFQVLNAQGDVTMEVSSPFWRIWTFPFLRRGQEVARISKKWSGIGFEMFTDRDNFMVEYTDTSLNQDERALVLAASLYVDLMFFESKGSGGIFGIGD